MEGPCIAPLVACRWWWLAVLLLLVVAGGDAGVDASDDASGTMLELVCSVDVFVPRGPLLARCIMCHSDRTTVTMTSVACKTT